MIAATENTPVARLAASQLKRIRRIVDAAVDLAEEGGFDGVRLRDVAEASAVALGTLYKYFRSKEDILLFALNEELEKVEVAIAERPLKGETPLERLDALFSRATRALTRRPHFAHAVLRSIGSGEPVTATKVATFHLRMSRLTVSALRGQAPDPSADLTELNADPREQSIAMVLNHVWFATLLGWTGGLHSSRLVMERMRETLDLLLDPS